MNSVKAYSHRRRIGGRIDGTNSYSENLSVNFKSSAAVPALQVDNNSVVKMSIRPINSFGNSFAQFVDELIRLWCE